MSDLLTFCESRIETVSLEIIETQKELDTKLENEACEEINATFRKNDEINRKHPQQGKNKTFTNYKKLQKLTTTYYLPETFKHMDKTDVLTKTNAQNRLAYKNMDKTNALTKTCTKQTCLQKTCTKQACLQKGYGQNRRAYKNVWPKQTSLQKTCTKQTCLQKTFRQNRRAYKKPRFTDSSRYEENQKATKENLDEEVKRLKNEVAYLKKDHITPPQHFLLTRRQILTVPPSKPLPQKTLHDNNNS